MRTSFIYTFFIGFIFLGLHSCKVKDRVFDDFQPLPMIWTHDDTVSFNIDIPDTAINYNVNVHLRYAHIYPYYNLYIQSSLSEDQKLNKLHTLILFDEVTGKPLGNGLGDVWDITLPLFTDIRFSNAKNKLNIQQFMRTDSLKGIDRVGIQVVKSQ